MVEIAVKKNGMLKSQKLQFQVTFGLQNPPFWSSRTILRDHLTPELDSTTKITIEKSLYHLYRHFSVLAYA